LFGVFARLADLLISGQEPLQTWFQPAIAVMFAIAAVWANPRVHWAVILGAVLLFLGQGLV